MLTCAERQWWVVVRGIGVDVRIAGGLDTIKNDCIVVVFFFFKQKTAYEIVDCDWSSDGVLFRSPTPQIQLSRP